MSSPPSNSELTSPDKMPALTPTRPPAWLRAHTPARVALRRAGISLATPEVLAFQLAHARARDAVHAPLQAATLLPTLIEVLPSGAPAPILLHSQAADRQTYLQRPDLGRKLNESSKDLLKSITKPAEIPHNPAGHSAQNHDDPLPSPRYDVAIILADGLSSLAVERNVAPLLAELLPTLQQTKPTPRLAPICIVEQARVAIGDEIAHLLSARLAIVLIGERPGLSSPDSLGAYITWNPKPGLTTDANRNCISNIRTEGLTYPQAAARLLYYIQEAQSRQTTGVALKDPDPHQLPQLAAQASPQASTPKPAGEPA